MLSLYSNYLDAKPPQPPRWMTVVTLTALALLTTAALLPPPNEARTQAATALVSTAR
jgi:hypothetical protein